MLNVLPLKADRDVVLNKLRDLLSADGRAYITVRADRNKLNGWTTKGTWQGLIALALPVLYQRSDYVTYILTKTEELAKAA